MRRLAIALALLALAGAAWALDRVGGNNWERGAYSSCGAIRFTSAGQDSTIYFFQANGDTVAASPDSQRWSFILGAATAGGVRLPTTTGQFYSIGKMRQIQHLELLNVSGSTQIVQLTFCTGGSFKSQYVELPAFLPPRVFHIAADSVKVRNVQGTTSLGYLIW